MEMPETNGAGSEHAPEYYKWEIPAKRVLVHLKLSVVDGVRQIAFVRNPENREIGGLLIGHGVAAGSKEVWVEDFVPIRLEHLRAGMPFFPASDASSPVVKNDQQVIGYYRTHNRSGGLFLDDADVALMRTHFSEPHAIALLIQPSRTAAGTAGIFFWEGSHIRTESSYLEFPFRREELQATTPELPEPAVAAVGPQQQASSTDRLLKAPWTSWLWLPFLTATLVILPLLFYWASSTQQPAAPRADLSLSAERGAGGALRVSWNRNNPVVREAQGGTLWITDGGTTKRLDLDSGQVTSGTVVYWPNSADLSFRLQVFAPGRSALETIRAVGAPDQKGTPPPVAASAQPVPVPVDEPSPKETAFAPTESRKPPAQQTQQQPPVIERSRSVLPPVTAEVPGIASNTAPPGLPAKPTPAGPALAKPEAPQPSTVASIPPPAAQPNPSAAFRPSAAVARVSFESIDESRFRKAINSVPVLRLLQRRRYKSGDDFVPARPVKEVTPTIPITLRKALGNDQVTVDVKVEVDDEGHVKKLEAPDSHTHADFIKLASDTARKWKFEPATMRGRQVASSVMLHFQFTPVNR